MIVNIIIMMMMIYLISYFLYFDFNCKYTKYFSFYFYSCRKKKKNAAIIINKVALLFAGQDYFLTFA